LHRSYWAFRSEEGKHEDEKNRGRGQVLKPWKPSTGNDSGHINHLDGMPVAYQGAGLTVRARVLRLNVGATNQERLDEERQILLSKFDRIIRGNKK
jgi:hypothetical protein